MHRHTTIATVIFALAFAWVADRSVTEGSPLVVGTARAGLGVLQNRLPMWVGGDRVLESRRFVGYANVTTEPGPPVVTELAPTKPATPHLQPTSVPVADPELEPNPEPELEIVVEEPQPRARRRRTIADGASQGVAAALREGGAMAWLSGVDFQVEASSSPSQPTTRQPIPGPALRVRPATALAVRDESLSSPRRPTAWRTQTRAVVFAGKLAASAQAHALRDRADGAVRRSLGRVRSCYDAALRTEPTLRGTMDIAMTVETRGRVARVDIERDTIGDPDLRACVQRRLQRPLRGLQGPVELRFPVVFRAT